MAWIFIKYGGFWSAFLIQNEDKTGENVFDFRSTVQYGFQEILFVVRHMHD